MQDTKLPVTDELPILLRCFIGPDPESKEKKPPQSRNRVASNEMPEWMLVFDTETTTDALQNLRFGTYQLRRKDELFEEGIFYDPRTMSASEIDLTRHYAVRRGLVSLDLKTFMREVFVGKAYELRASIVGFNLPFDISRIAARYNSARGKAMKGGFTFSLLDDPYSPYVQVKHLNSRAALIQFALPKAQQNSRSQRCRKMKSPARRGHFIDLKTIAAALFSRSFSLESLADFLQTPSRKSKTDDHGQKLTETYLDYAVQDTQVTWECFVALRNAYEERAIKSTPIGKILSEASLGKAYLKDMGIRPFLKCQPDFPHALTGQIMSSYFGGRSEVHIRRQIGQVLYCDFLSMYPTVCTMMQLWQFVIATGVDWYDSTAQTAAFLEVVKPDDLQEKACWLQLRTLVRLRPDAQILPARAKYDGETHNIGLNYLTSEVGLWYTLADAVASKLLTGKTPAIDQAITFVPRVVQDGLKPICIAGKESYRVSPATDDFYRRVIDLRSKVKENARTANGHEKEMLDTTQLALKLLANSTSYGIFVELNTTEQDDHQRLCYGYDGNGFAIDLSKSAKIEEPGPYFHPLLATLITGAARLMLALAETKTIAEGLDWAFCDTDSMAIAKPDGMTTATFFEKAKRVCGWFDPLNPYEKKGGLFKIEDANFAIDGSRKLQSLYAYCISSKRYVLFNYDDDGSFIIRKASAHGLGHLLPPYGADDAPADIPEPAIELTEIGVERWQHDLWMEILEAAHSDCPNEVDLEFHPNLRNPAISRYTASSPNLHRWFKGYNAGKPEIEQVKPFNFLLSFIAKRDFGSQFGNVYEKPKRGRPKNTKPISPVAPYSKDPIEAARNAFDRETGKTISVEELMTYREALAQYHMHPEAKFLDADFMDAGSVRRRHIKALLPTYIGKESNALEEQYFLGISDDLLMEIQNGNRDAIEARLQALSGEASMRKLAKVLGIGRATLAKALSGGLDAISRTARRQLELSLLCVNEEKLAQFKTDS